MQLETGIAKEKTPYDDEILTYFRQLLPLDKATVSQPETKPETKPEINA